MKNELKKTKGYLSQITMTGWLSFEQQKKMKIYLAKANLNFSEWLRAQVDKIK